ncbi:hypothetical protein MASR1M31_13250 [Porphyromonadaceae bacterium]
MGCHHTFDAFNAVKNKSKFKHAELSWLEMDENVDRAIGFLPIQLKKRLKKPLKQLGPLLYFAECKDPPM